MFRMHRTVLASSSSFMLGLLTSDMRESSGEIELHEMKAGVFAACEHWMYTGQCAVEENDLVSLLSAANQLDLGELKAAAAQSVIERLDSENFISLWDLGSRFAIEELAQAARKLALAKFSSLPPDALATLPADSFQELLEADELGVDSEDEVFRALIRWTDAPANAMSVPLLQAVRIPLISSSFMREHVYPHPLMRTADMMMALSTAFEAAWRGGTVTPRRSLVACAGENCSRRRLRIPV